MHKLTLMAGVAAAALLATDSVNAVDFSFQGARTGQQSDEFLPDTDA